MKPIKLEHGIPIPKSRNEGGMTSVIREMKVGDSFQTSETNRPNVSMFGRRLGVKLTCRKIAPGVCRVWRVE